MLSTSNAASKWLAEHPRLDGISLMDHLFSRLNGAYPNKWRSNFRDEYSVNDWKVTWAEAFDEDGITPHDVAAGIKNCRRMYDWPPSLSEFLRACRPGLDPEAAFHEAVQGMIARRKGERGEWSHPAIFHAAIRIGQHDMLGGSYAMLRGRWEKALHDELAAREWAPIPDALVALAAPAKTEMSNDEARRAMARLGVSDLVKRTGHPMNDWAKRIVANPKNHCHAAIAMAQRALSQTP